MGRRGFDAIEAVQNAATGLAGGFGTAGRVKQIAGGFIERGGEGENHVGIEMELAAFVVGNDGLGEPGSLGELDLSEAAFAVETGETLAWRFVAER